MVQPGLARPWAVAEAASRKPVEPHDVGCCKPGAMSAVGDCLVLWVETIHTPRAQECGPPAGVNVALKYVDELGN